LDGVNNIETPTTHLLQGVTTYRTIAIKQRQAYDKGKIKKG
jgi:hypothetical protein